MQKERQSKTRLAEFIEGESNRLSRRILYGDVARGAGMGQPHLSDILRGRQAPSNIAKVAILHSLENLTGREIDPAELWGDGKEVAKGSNSG